MEKKKVDVPAVIPAAAAAYESDWSRETRHPSCRALASGVELLFFSLI